MLLSKCAVCESKKSRFIKKQVASGLVTNLLVLESSFERVLINIISNI